MLFQPIVSQSPIIVSLSETWSQPDRRRTILDGLAVLLEREVRLAAGVVYIGRLRVQTEGDQNSGNARPSNRTRRARIVRLRAVDGFAVLKRALRAEGVLIALAGLRRF